MPNLSKKIVFFLFATICNLRIFAQVGFQKEYGTPSNDQGCYVTGIEGDKILIAGTVLLENKQHIQFLKLDSCLNKQFAKEYSENELEGIGYYYNAGNYFQNLPNDQLAIIANTGRFGVNNNCPLLIKLDKGGNIVFSNSYYRGFGFEPLCLTGNGIGGFYFSGVDNGNAVTCNVDSIGKLKWTKKITSKAGNLRPKILIPQPSKEFWAVYDYVDINILYCAVICKFDSGGSSLLRKIIKPNYQLKTIYFSGAVSMNDKTIVCGSTNDFGNYQGLVFCIDKTGTIDWMRTYDCKDSSSGLYNPILSNDGSISIVGYSNHDASKSDGILLKIDQQGNLKWARRYKDTSNVQLTCHTQTTDGGFCLLGNKLNYTKNQDFYFIKVDSLGRSACDYETMDVEVTDRTFKIDTTIEIYDSVITDMVAYPMNMKVKDVAVKERTYCTTQEPFAGIGAVLGQDTIIVCDSNSYHIVNYKANPYSKYYWSTGDTDRTGITVTQTGMYKLRVVKEPCESVDSVYIIIANMGNIVPAMHDTSGCAGSMIVLNALLKNGAANNIYTYNWNTNDTVQTINVNNSGVYKVTIKNQYGCILYDSAKVQFLNSLKLIAMADTFICKGQSIIRFAKAKGGDSLNLKCTWYDINGNILSNTQSINTGSLNVTTTYICSVADECTILYDTVTIKVRKPLQVSFTSPIDICRGDTALLYVEGSGGDTLAYSFNWDNGLKKGKSQRVSPASSTIYKVTLHDNCTLKDDTATIIVNVNNPTAAFNALPQRTTLFQPQIIFNNNSINATSSNWYFGDGDSCVNQTFSSQYHNYKDTGMYRVKLFVTNNFGCIDSAINYIIIADTFTCYIPNAFYPKSKFGNHIFYPVVNNTAKIDMQIYNRWGELVYKTPEDCQPINGKYISGNDCGAWNGKFMNTHAECEQGEYLFMIRFIDLNMKAHDYNGIVYLIR